MLASNTFDTIHDLLKKHPGLSGAIGIEKATVFICLMSRLKILFKQRASGLATGVGKPMGFRSRVSRVRVR